MTKQTKRASSEIDAAESEQGGERCQQVLMAAEECFRRFGFHATSIQRISEVAGMSPGHIYHYFRNKEAIVAGIVEQRLAELLERVEILRDKSSTAGVVEAWISQIEPGIAFHASSERRSLDLEILAEATRNEGIAAMVQQADAVSRDVILDLMKQAPALQKLPSKELSARLAVMRTIFDGLAVRTLCDPSLNRAATIRVIKRVIRVLLEEVD
jgi:AcrR family transcriptional regulator